MSVAVIGSGPAGVAAAHALSDAGHRVIMLDAGDEIEPGRMDVFAELAQSEPELWPSELAHRARGAFPVSVKRVPLKPAYGSLFPYALDDPDLDVVGENTETLPSLARGGLSNAWGASILPVRRQDIADWPIALDRLVPHYQAVLRFMPLAAEHDELSALLPLYTNTPGVLPRGPQAMMLLKHMRRHATALKQAGFAFGASRLAVRTGEGDPHRCRLSGMCLYGCPYSSIYNATHTLDALVRAGRVDYRGGVYVDRLQRAEGSVAIHFHDRARHTATGRLTASRVFVACGAISSTRLLLESSGRPQLECKMQDSQYFIMPMLTPRALPVSVVSQGNTLAQVFLELQDARISNHGVHLQLYGYNDLMLAALTQRFPSSAERLERLLRPALGRLIVLQGFVHSADSPGLTVGLQPRGVRLLGMQAADSATRVKRLARLLAANARLLGMIPIPGLAQAGRPGKGNHLGGSLPMRRVPAAMETDVLGRLADWERVHVVDASVLPSVPATTVTLTVMANAHRIATDAARDLSP